MKTEFFTISAFTILSFLIGQEVWSQESIQNSSDLEIQFSDNSAQNYNISVTTDEKFLLSQSYSWSRDEHSRYNLLGYTIDDADFVEIPRKARGEFTLDILMDTKHTIIFKTIIQYPIEINGINEFDSSPKSPTSDNWFDLNSEIEFLVPYLIESEKDRTRLELKNWSLDNSLSKTVDSSENEMFVTPKIPILDSHNLSFGYQTQHKVEVHSSLGEIKGTGWYDEGKTATVTA